MALTPEQLAQLQAKYDANMAEMEKLSKEIPGVLANNPEPTSLFNDLDRAKMSFGDDEHIQALLEANGYKNVGKNKSGDLVAQLPDGTWVKDNDAFLASKFPFIDHPVNWAEARLGHALPLIGAGALAGGGLVGSGGTALPASVALAGVGGLIGESARRMIGAGLGVQTPPTPAKAAGPLGVGAEMAAAELGPQLLMRSPVGPPLRKSAQWLLDKAKGAIAAISSKGAGVPIEAAERAIERPNEVLAANLPGRSLRVGQLGQTELETRNAIKQRAVALAREKFEAGPGQEVVPTNDLISMNQDYLQKKAPNSAGEGPLTGTEWRRLRRLEEQSFTTPKMAPEPIPGAYSSRPVFSREPRVIQPEVQAGVYEPSFVKDGPQEDFMTPVAPQIKKAGPAQTVSVNVEPRIVAKGNQVDVSQPITPKLTYGKPEVQKVPTSQGYQPLDVPVSTVDLSMEPVGSMTKMQPVETVFKRTGNVQQTPIKTEITQNGPTAKVQPMRPSVTHVEDQVVQPEVQLSDLTGYESKMPEKSLNDLYKTADSYDAKIKAYFDRAKAAGRSDAELNQLQALRGKIKDMIHAKDEGLAATDADFHQFKSDAKEYLSPLEKGKSAQSFVDNIYGANKDAHQEALARHLPRTAEYVKDMGAFDAFNADPILANNKISARGALRLAGLAGAGAGSATGHPGLAALAASLSAITSPRFHRFALTRGSQMAAPFAQSFVQNPLQAPAYGLMQEGLSRTPWSILKQRGDQ
jgi:hypothetical protein